MSKRSGGQSASDRDVNLVSDSAPSEPSQPTPPKEPKAHKFVRLANRRVSAALRAIGGVAVLGNRASYEHTPEQAAAIIAALTDAVTAVHMSMDGAIHARTDWKLNV